MGSYAKHKTPTYSSSFLETGIKDELTTFITHVSNPMNEIRFDLS